DSRAFSCYSDRCRARRPALHAVETRRRNPRMLPSRLEAKRNADTATNPTTKADCSRDGAAPAFFRPQLRVLGTDCSVHRVLSRWQVAIAAFHGKAVTITRETCRSTELSC